MHRWNFPLFCAGGALPFIVANPRTLVKPQDMAVPVNSATSGVGYGVQNGVRFCAHRHARGHRNSPPDCCYPGGLPCSSLSIIVEQKSKAKSLAYFIGADYETRPVRFCAHRHARGHRDSPLDCCYPCGLPCSSLAQRYYEQKSTRRNALCFLLERITRLELAASTLARWRSTR